MEKLYYPQSIVIIGLSSKDNNIPRLILENLLRWGFMGRIMGVNPSGKDRHVDGIKMYKTVSDLPIVPDLAVALIPAKYIPAVIDECGEKGIRRMAIPSGGFNEFGSDGVKLADLAVEKARAWGIKFVGPNGVTIANTANGLCLPFVPSFRPMKGSVSIITQSGGVGLMLWNYMSDEDIGLAKFASIGNKLDLDEVDFLEYFGRDPETQIICLYLESISRGSDFLQAARAIDKPIIVLKANTTSAGRRAAMSHTAALSNDDRVLDEALRDAGVIRIHNFSDFISVAKVFKLPPMRGNNIMVMSPAGGLTVMMADLCEKHGFDFADPGEQFFNSLKEYGNAGVINFSNPLDMGDIYNPRMYAEIFYSVLHNDNVDGAVYVSQWPQMPRGDDVFTRMFKTDLSNETIGSIQSSGKPLCVTLFGPAKTTSRIKQNISLPIFNNPEEMIAALKIQMEFYRNRDRKNQNHVMPEGFDAKALADWTSSRSGNIGEDALDAIRLSGIPVPVSSVARDQFEAQSLAADTGFPVVMKVISPDALHKSEAGGVITGILNPDDAAESFAKIQASLRAYNADAVFEGVRVMKEIKPGLDMFVGGVRDGSFGPVVFFGLGGIYIELFDDTACVLCPVSHEMIREKIMKLKSWKLLKGMRGAAASDVESFIDAVVNVSWIMAECAGVKELDINPLRVLADGEGCVALDARMRLEH